jgi:hypothetical protein
MRRVAFFLGLFVGPAFNAIRFVQFCPSLLAICALRKQENSIMLIKNCSQWYRCVWLSVV